MIRFRLKVGDVVLYCRTTAVQQMVKKSIFFNISVNPTIYIPVIMTPSIVKTLL